VYEGGTFIGVNQPSAVEGYDTFFRMAHVLGVDEDTGARVVHGRWPFEAKEEQGLLPEGSSIEAKSGIYLTDGAADVVQQSGGRITLSVNAFGKGKGIYLPSFEFSLENTRLLLNLIRYAGGELNDNKYITDNLYTECAYYPESKILVVINNSAELQKTSVETEYGVQTLELAPYDTVITTIG
jgi:hypothetical protein